MAHHLLLGTASENWRLPAETDLAALTDQMSDAAKSGEVLQVVVEMNNDPLNRMTIYVNPSVIGWWGIYHQPEPDEA